jgi:hypothetical protein
MSNVIDDESSSDNDEVQIGCVNTTGWKVSTGAHWDPMTGRALYQPWQGDRDENESPTQAWEFDFPAMTPGLAGDLASEGSNRAQKPNCDADEISTMQLAHQVLGETCLPPDKWKMATTGLGMMRAIIHIEPRLKFAKHDSALNRDTFNYSGLLAPLSAIRSPPTNYGKQCNSPWWPLLKQFPCGATTTSNKSRQFPMIKIAMSGLSPTMDKTSVFAMIARLTGDSPSSVSNDRAIWFATVTPAAAKIMAGFSDELIGGAKCVYYAPNPKQLSAVEIHKFLMTNGIFCNRPIKVRVMSEQHTNPELITEIMSGPYTLMGDGSICEREDAHTVEWDCVTNLSACNLEMLRAIIRLCPDGPAMESIGRIENVALHKAMNKPALRGLAADVLSSLSGIRIAKKRETRKAVVTNNGATGALLPRYGPGNMGERTQRLDYATLHLLNGIGLNNV